MANLSRINDILDRIAEIQMTVSLDGSLVNLGRVNTAYARTPADPSSEACPFCVNVIRGGPSTFGANYIQEITSRVIMYFCVSRAEADSTLMQAQLNTLEYRDIVFATFASHFRLSKPADGSLLTYTLNGSSAPYIRDAFITEWDQAELPIGATTFIALKFVLEINEAFVQPITP